MILLDTHVLVWLIEGDERLGHDARLLIDDERVQQEAYVSAITPWEISMLVDKGRLRLSRNVEPWIVFAFGIQGVKLAPIEPIIGVDAGSLRGGIHGDPADRLIVATSRAMACPLLTADGPILRYAQRGHVQIIDARR